MGPDIKISLCVLHLRRKCIMTIAYFAIATTDATELWPRWGRISGEILAIWVS